MTTEINLPNARNELLEDYLKSGAEQISINTLPYVSTKSVRFDIVNADATEGYAFAVARRGQVIPFFDYGVGQTIQLGADPQHIASEQDTNLEKAKSTNGAADCAIEGVSFGAAGLRIAYPAAELPDFVDAGAVADPAVTLALTGFAPVRDPGSILIPPEFDSPVNLEDVAAQLVTRHASIEFEWDRRRIEKLGMISQFPEGASNSYLKSIGQPRTDNIWAIPEGYRWARDGQPDCGFVARMILAEDLVIPIHLVVGYEQDSGYNTPTAIWLDVVMRLHVFAVSIPSAN